MCDIICYRYTTQWVTLFKGFTPFIVIVKKKLANHQPRLDAWDKCSDLVHWEDLEGSGGEGGWRGDGDGEYM